MHAQLVTSCCRVELSSGPVIFGVLFSEEFLVNHFVVNCCCLRLGIRSAFRFLYRAIVYTGAATEGGNGEDGLGAKVVKQLVQPLNGKGHHVYYDNFFSSVALARDMLEKGNYTVARTTR